jgi:hypothetical protein
MIITVEKLWDELWEADKQKKDERAERDAKQLEERNRVQVRQCWTAQFD